MVADLTMCLGEDSGDIKGYQRDIKVSHSRNEISRIQMNIIIVSDESIILTFNNYWGSEGTINLYIAKVVFSEITLHQTPIPSI